MSDKRILFLSQESVIHPVTGEILNAGDLVYFMAGASFFYKQNVTYLSQHEVQVLLYKNADFVKNNFDIVITMHSDLFRESYLDWLTDVTSLYSRFHIPIYVLGICVNTLDLDYKFNPSDKLKNAILRFVDLIKDGGGDLTLRGDFTKECLSSLGRDYFFASGCPSLFLRGDCNLSKPVLSKEEFRPCFNANAAQNIPFRFYKEFTDSVYFDQDNYVDFLYHPETLSEERLRRLRPVVKYLLATDRLVGEKNYALWVRKLRNGKFNFFYGRKLHGNIIGLQMNIPCFVVPIDVRMREVCDFYSIPNPYNHPFDETKEDLFDLYSSLDFSEFNLSYRRAFLAFKKYLDSHDIPNNFGDSSDFIEYINSLCYYDYQNDTDVVKTSSLVRKELCHEGYDKI